MNSILELLNKDNTTCEPNKLHYNLLETICLKLNSDDKMLALAILSRLSYLADTNFALLIC